MKTWRLVEAEMVRFAWLARLCDLIQSVGVCAVLDRGRRCRLFRCPGHRDAVRRRSLIKDRQVDLLRSTYRTRRLLRHFHRRCDSRGNTK